MEQKIEEKIIKSAIDKVMKEQYKSIEVYFGLMIDHDCIKRIDVREQMIMKTMPLVFKKKLLQELGIYE